MIQKIGKDTSRRSKETVIYFGASGTDDRLEDDGKVDSDHQRCHVLVIFVENKKLMLIFKNGTNLDFGSFILYDRNLFHTIILDQSYPVFPVSWCRFPRSSPTTHHSRLLGSLRLTAQTEAVNPSNKASLVVHVDCIERFIVISAMVPLKKNPTAFF